jgi:hypothetical protein
MENHNSCISQNLNIINSKEQYCKCEIMHRAGEEVVELARSAGALFEYHKQKRKFLLHSQGRIYEFDPATCFWCNLEIFAF